MTDSPLTLEEVAAADRLINHWQIRISELDKTLHKAETERALLRAKTTAARFLLDCFAKERNERSGEDRT